MPDQKLTQIAAAGSVLADVQANDLYYVVRGATSYAIRGSSLNNQWLQRANNLSDLTNAATARTNLGVAIGVNVQAYDPFLTSIATLGTAADKMIYTTGIDTAAEADLTPFARTILDDANAAAVRTTIGAGTTTLPVVDETALVFKTGTPANTLTFDVDAFTGPQTWTFPDATTTVAGLGVAQTFTSAQTVQGPTATTIPLTIKTTDDNATNPLLKFVNSGGTLTSQFNYIGNYYNQQTFTNSAGSIILADLKCTLNPAANSTATDIPLQVALDTGGARTFSETKVFNVNFRHLGSNTLTAAYGGYVICRNRGPMTTGTGLFLSAINDAAGGAAGTMHGFFGDIRVSNGSVTNMNGLTISQLLTGGTITNAKAINIDTPQTGSTITNWYGLWIGNVTTATTNNYAIYTNTGINYLGDATTIDQQSATGAKPVLTLDQADIDYVLMKIIGSANAASADRTLVADSDYGTPGALVGWIQIEIQDDGNRVADGDYYIPFYAAPT